MLAGGLYERASGSAARPLAGYRRPTPERTVLHELVARHAHTMLAELRDAAPEGGGLEMLNRIVRAYLEFAELQASTRRPMRIADWIRKLDEYLQLSDAELRGDLSSSE